MKTKERGNQIIMEYNPMISIVVPVYNTAEYLAECLDSICNQTYDQLEIIVIDDGSTDGSGKICDEFASKDSRLKVIHKENGGLVNARKDGVKAATGEYVIYVDGDDWIELDMVEKLIQVTDNYSVDMVICGRYDNLGDTSTKVFHGFKEGIYNKNVLESVLYKHMIAKPEFYEFGIFPSAWAKLFKRKQLEIYQDKVDAKLTLGEDVALVYELLLNVDSIYILDECLYHYRQREQSMVRVIEDKQKEKDKFLNLHKNVWSRLKNYDSKYNLKTQWMKHMMFSMIPRADSLCEGFSSLGYLFPYPHVKAGSRIVIYGMGLYGQRLYNYLKETGLFEVIAGADKNYKELNKHGLNVISPESLIDLDYDDLVITLSYAKTRNAVYNDLKKKHPNEKLHIMDEKLIFSDEVLERFGLSFK